MNGFTEEKINNEFKFKCERVSHTTIRTTLCTINARSNVLKAIINDFSVAAAFFPLLSACRYFWMRSLTSACSLYLLGMEQLSNSLKFISFIHHKSTWIWNSIPRLTYSQHILTCALVAYLCHRTTNSSILMNNWLKRGISNDEREITIPNYLMSYGKKIRTKISW